MFSREPDDYQKAIKMLKEARRDGEPFMVYIDHKDEGLESCMVVNLKTSSIFSLVVYLMDKVTGLSDCIKMYFSEKRH